MINSNETIYQEFLGKVNGLEKGFYKQYFIKEKKKKSKSMTDSFTHFFLRSQNGENDLGVFGFDKIEFRDASKIWGMECLETYNLLQEKEGRM